MATKIRLMRLGKMRAPHYRVVVTDSRTKRDGRSIETIGKYHPKEDPSYIDIDAARALYWLRVGAQPTEAVEALLKVTGAWQEFKGLPAPPPMKVAAAKTDKKAVFEAAAKAAMSDEPVEKPKAAKKAAPPKAEAEAPAEPPAAAPVETPAEPEAPVAEAPAAEAPAEPEAPAAEAAPAEAVEAPAAEEAAPAGAPAGE